jgi:bilirubin oxidase
MLTKSRTVRISDKGPGTPFFFDNGAYDPNLVNQTVTLGATEAWTISNDRVFSHSFHIHDVEFKIVARSSGTIAAYEQGWKDTVAVPLGETVTFVWTFADFADVINPFMYHCHFSNHEDEA